MTFLQKQLPTHSLVLVLLTWQGITHANEDDTCQLPNSGNINGKVLLNANCTYNQGITINTSDTSLDCNGARVDGLNTQKIGILVSSKGGHLSSVEIKNCTVTGFIESGVLITSQIPNYQRSDNHNFNYEKTPKNITLENMKITSNSGVGVYFHSYVTNSTIKNSIVENSKAEGIYLDQSSRNNNIINNTIQRNGELNGPSSGQRVGLAIDSSANNLIESNKFIENFGGGIFLYKNCGENFSKGFSKIRWQHSNENTIKSNSFTDEKVGIWIASRQSSNLQNKDCGDKPLDSENKYYEDFADNNTIENNKFCRNKRYIIVEGNYNTITNNQSDNKTNNWIIQPSSMKARLTGIPTTGNKINNNKYEECNR